MAFLDILKGRKREEVKPERLPKGVFSPKANQPLAEKRVEKPAKKREEISAKGGLASAGEKQKKDKKDAEEKEPKKQPAKIAQSTLAAELLLRPHITEQSSLLTQKNIYTFHVSPRANKILIKKAIQEMYGFKPVKVRVINTHSKKRIVQGKKGIKPGFKKALVYLKSSDKIEFV